MSVVSQCPECGASHREDFVRCPACRAFVIDHNPWRGDFNLYAIPIALFAWLLVNIGIWMANRMTHFNADATGVLYGDPISQAIFGFFLYGMVVLLFKWQVTARQQRTFRLLKQCCAAAQRVDRATLDQARQEIDAAGLRPFNLSVAYHRLRLLVTALASPELGRDGVLQVMRQHADSDWDSLENSYSSSQFLIWLLPTAGFLGTVYGMTEALSHFSAIVGTTSNDLSFSAALTATTQNLGVAFHTTLVGLACVIPLLALATALRRRAYSVLEHMDKYFLRLATFALSQAAAPATDPALAEPPTGTAPANDVPLTEPLDVLADDEEWAELEASFAVSDEEPLPLAEEFVLAADDEGAAVPEAAADPTVAGAADEENDAARSPEK